MSEEKLEKEFAQLRELSKADKKIDVAGLMISALQKQQANLLSSKEKRWAYLISLVAPPFGLIFSFKFYFSGKDDGEQAAWMCGILTAIGILAFVLFGKIILSGSGLGPSQLQQIEQIKPSDIQQLTQ